MRPIALLVRHGNRGATCVQQKKSGDVGKRRIGCAQPGGSLRAASNFRDPNFFGAKTDAKRRLQGCAYR